MNGRKAFEHVRAPDEQGAQHRAWTVVRAAYVERTPAPTVRVRLRLAVLGALTALAGGVVLSPAGATIARLIKDTLGVPHAAKALFSLPAPGRLVVSGPGGTWSIAADGSARRLGPWRQASWSPHGLYIAVARSDQLAAVDPRGVLRWTLARRAVSAPRWYPPSGYRIAYLSDRTLRVVAGDGTGDHLLATGVARVAPAWRPEHPYELAYVTGTGRVAVRYASARRVAWTARPGAVPLSLAWSSDGSRLLVVTPKRALIYDPNGRLSSSIAGQGPILDGSLSPAGRRLALLIGGPVDRVALANIVPGAMALTPVFSGAGLRQLSWSPNGHWLLVSWPAADQWVFLRVAGGPKIDAVSRIAQQFSAGSRRAFPRLQGWCCLPWPPTR